MTRQTGFIMRYWQKFNAFHYRFSACARRGLALICCLLMPIASAAQGITIQQVSGSAVDGYYYLDARIEFELEDEVLRALRHGVALNIDVLIRIKRKRRWLWDPTIKKDIMSYILEHHALSNYYLITNLVTGVRRQFQTLEEALIFLGKIKAYPLFNTDMLETDKEYSGYIRAKLNIETLPPPLRPVAYVSRQWRLNSPWYKWVVK